MIKTELRIQGDTLAPYEDKLRFSDALPVVLGYARVSTDEQAKENHSISTQFRHIRKLCNDKFPEGCHLILIADEGYSGMLPYRKPGIKQGKFRPGLTLVTELAERRMLHALAVYKLNRLARSSRVFHEFCDDFLKQFKIQPLSCVEQIGIEMGAEEYITTLLMIMAGFERTQILQVCREGQQSRVKEGYPLGGLGYGWEWEDKRELKRNAPGQKVRVGIQPVPDQIMNVKAMIEWFLAGRSLTWIASELERNGIASPGNKKRWATSTIRRILINPLHRGQIRNLQKELKKGAHSKKGFVEESTFHLIQARFREQARVASPTRRTRNHLLGAHLHCEICAQRLRLITGAGRPARYKCKGQEVGNEHPVYTVCVEPVEEVVLQYIKQTSAHPERLKSASEQVGKLIDQEDRCLEKEEKRFLSALQANKKALIRWMSEYQEGTINKEEFGLYREVLESERNQISTSLNEISERMIQRRAREIRVEKAIDLLGHFDELWDSMSLDERRTFFDYLVEKLTISPRTDDFAIQLKTILQEEVVLTVPRTQHRCLQEQLLTRSVMCTAQLLSQGHSSAQIAMERDLSVRTVYRHREQVRNLSSKGDLAEALQRVKKAFVHEQEESVSHRNRKSPFHERFTARQLQLLGLLAQRRTNHEIAAAIGIKKQTVASMRQVLYRKLEVNNWKDALKIAYQRQLIPALPQNEEKPTKRQLQVLQVLETGVSQPEIARHLDLSLSAVKQRIRTMLRKYRCSRAFQLLELAQQKGWIS